MANGMETEISPVQKVDGLGGADSLFQSTADPSIQMISLDVFDTVLTRLTGTPPTIFLLLGKRLAANGLIRDSPEVFARARVTAERVCRTNLCAHEDVTLEEIYIELAKARALSATARERIMSEELSLERDLLRPVPQYSAWFSKPVPPEKPFHLFPIRISRMSLSGNVSARILSIAKAMFFILHPVIDAQRKPGRSFVTYWP
jgi:hypothetical protein